MSVNWCLSFPSYFQWCFFTSQGLSVAMQHVGSVESSSLNLPGICFTVMIH